MKRHDHRLQRDARNGNWFIWLQRSGRKKYFNLGPNRRKAAQKLLCLETQVAAGQIEFVEQGVRPPTPPQQMTLEELAALHLKYVKEHSPDSTFKLRQHYVSMFFGFAEVLLVSELTNQLVDSFYQWVRRNHSRGPNGGRHALEETKAFLKWGQDHGHCTNPITKWPKVKYEPPETKNFRDDELLALLRLVPTDFRDLLTFCFLTGLRPQEIRIVTVGNVVRFEGRPVALFIEHHKTSASSRSHRPRSVPLSDAAAEIAQRLGAGRRDNDCLFPNTDGLPYTTRAIRQRLVRWCKKCGITAKPTYALRHGFGVKQGLLKTNQGVLMGLMGHTSIKTTTRYQLNIDEASVNAVKELDGHFSRILGASDANAVNAKVLPIGPPSASNTSQEPEKQPVSAAKLVRNPCPDQAA